MIGFFTPLFLLGWRPVPCNGLPGITKLTTTTQAGAHEPAQSPRPTQAAVLAQKRDVAGNRTCGFVDGEFGPSPLTCNNDLQTCVVDEMAAVAGCCGTTSINQTLGYFVDCGFYSGCVDYSDSNTLTHLSAAATSAVDSETAPISGVNLSVSPLVQHALSWYVSGTGIIRKSLLIRSESSAASPFCATYPFTYDELTYSMLGCHRTSGKFPLRPLSYLATYTQPSDTFPSSPPSSNPSLNTSTPSHSAARSAIRLAEIIVPSVVGGLAIGVALVICFSISRRISTQKKGLRDRGEGPANRSSPIQPGEEVLTEQRREYIGQTSKDAFLIFLSSYGPSGVSLREVIMLGTLRQAEENSKNHWSTNGEPEYVPQSRSRRTFVDDFMDAVRDSGSIESFETQLKSSGLIRVEYPEGVQADETSQYWLTDERVWIIRGDQSSEPPQTIGGPTILQELLDVFIDMPDKDVFPAAQRQREIYYYHAHLLIRRIIQSREHLVMDRLLLGQAVFVTLQLLTHRFQTGDSLLLDFVRDNSVEALHPDMKVMLLWAELKETAFKEDCDGLCSIRDHALNLVNSNEVQSHATPRQNGFIGFILVDFFKNARASHMDEIVADVVKMGSEWSDSAQKSSTRTSIENIALCEILATFNIHARNDIIQEEYYLFYGFHLSRAGFLVQGDQFLARVLNNRDSVPLWSYEMERVSNSMRLGRQSEAAQMLKSIRQLALHNRDKGPYSILWKHSGECAETFILLNLYEADHSASAGRLDDACAKIKAGISITSSVSDTYIRVLRVTLEMRLLEIRMCQGFFKEALHVALNLASDVLSQRTRSTLAPNTIHVIVQQCLDLSNTLFAKGDAVASLALLKSITSMATQLPGDGFQELKSYVEQRMAKARQCSEIYELSRHEITTETMDTGIEDLISQVQTDTSSDMTVLQRRKTTAPTYPSLSLHSSYQNLSSLSEPTHLQSSARKDKGRGKHPSSKRFRSKPHSSTLGKILRAPRPPSKQPETFASGSGEKASQREGLPSQAELKPTVDIPHMP